MATLSDLVTAVAGATGLPEATVFAYGRFARQAKLISQKGRGRSAASMSLHDAANLIIAVAGTGITREAAATIRNFRSMKGRLFNFSGGLEPVFLQWLRPLGLMATAKNEFGNDYELQSDFGLVLEYLISATLNGGLAALFRQIPVAEVPGELWSEWKRTQSVHLHQSVDLLIEQGLICPKRADDLAFGEDISLEIAFNRLGQSVDIEFRRMWDSPETIFVASFSPKRRIQKSPPDDLRLVATITQHSLAAAGLVVSNMISPSAVRSHGPMDYLFAQQFRTSSPPGAS
jgi:hypothetical protein